MYKIVSKKALNEYVCEMWVSSPLIASKAKAGQFIILRVSDDGERIPLTIAGVNKEKGTVRIIFQIVGATTYKLNKLNEGDYIHDFVGPLGNPTNLNGIKKAIVVGGGVGSAIALPIACALNERGADVTSIIGFRNKDLIILENEFKSVSDRLIVITDDGSSGLKGNVTMPLKEILDKEKDIDMIIAIGPLIMMKFVTLTAKEYNVPVTVSMNPIMIDGTGMCGGCRLSLNKDGKKEIKFACIDGPDFNGYEIDFDEAISRSTEYKEFERKSYDKACNLMAKEVK